MSFTSTEILFEKFEIIDCLKKDVYSSVYLANHIYLGKQIILKTLNKKEMPDTAAIERFKREAKILAKVDDPNLIKVLDFGTYENFFYLSFEYFESKNLRTAMKDRVFSEADKKNIAVQLLKGLDAANRKGIIHRDIKPENLLLNDHNVLKIADFGLALSQNEVTLTSKSSIVGTPAYMSPEQIRGEKLTHQTDLFSAGIVIYELFLEKNPFMGEDIGETINNILNFREVSLHENLQELPSDMKDLITSLLRVNTKERGKSAGEVLFSSNLLTSGEFNSMIKSDNKNYLLIGSIILLLFIAAGVIYLTSNSRVKEQKPIITLTNEHKENNTPEVKNEPAVEEKMTKEVIKADGRLQINVFPWADINIDNTIFDKTPLRNDIIIKPGQHSIKLTHPDYPSYRKTILVEPGKRTRIDINFDKITGKLDCKVTPWGDIYIDGKKIGTTPLQKPVNLRPGTYNVRVVNEVVDGNKEFKIRIKAGVTTQSVVNFEENNQE